MEQGPNKDRLFNNERVLKRLVRLLSIRRLTQVRFLSEAFEQVANEELERRAADGDVRAVDFRWTHGTTAHDYNQMISRFFIDTRDFRGAFQHFAITFPNFTTLTDPETLSLFSQYPVLRLNLHVANKFIPNYTQGLLLKRLLKRLLHLISPVIQQLSIIAEPSSSLFVHFDHKLPENMNNLFFPVLKRLYLLRGDSTPASTLLIPLYRDILEIIFEYGHANAPVLQRIGVFLLPQPTVNIFTSPTFEAIIPNITRLEITQPSERLTHTRLYEQSRALLIVAYAGLRVNHLALDFLAPLDNPLLINHRFSVFANNITRFLALQAPTLLTLAINHSLNFRVNLETGLNGVWVMSFIVLPVFPVLLKLTFIGRSLIGLIYPCGILLLDPFFHESFPRSFPALMRFTIGGANWMRVNQNEPNFLSGMSSYEVGPPIQPLAIESLDVHIWDEMGEINRIRLQENFNQVSILYCKLSFLQLGRLSWSDTVRELHIRDIDGRIRRYIAQFTNLEILYADEDLEGNWPRNYFRFFTGISNYRLHAIIVRGPNVPANISAMLRVYYSEIFIGTQEREIGWLNL